MSKRFRYICDLAAIIAVAIVMFLAPYLSKRAEQQWTIVFDYLNEFNPEDRAIKYCRVVKGAVYDFQDLLSLLDIIPRLRRKCEELRPIVLFAQQERERMKYQGLRQVDETAGAVGAELLELEAIVSNETSIFKEKFAPYYLSGTVISVRSDGLLVRGNDGEMPHAYSGELVLVTGSIRDKAVDGQKIEVLGMPDGRFQINSATISRFSCGERCSHYVSKSRIKKLPPVQIGLP